MISDQRKQELKAAFKNAVLQVDDSGWDPEALININDMTEEERAYVMEFSGQVSKDLNQPPF